MKNKKLAKLLVEHIVTRHGVLGQLLSDRGKVFCQNRCMRFEFLGIKRVNITAYHPQTDGLVERCNRTLISMLAKTVQKQGRHRDEHFTLCAICLQDKCSRIHYGITILPPVWQPTDKVINAPVSLATTNMDDYRTEMTQRMASAWEYARQHT